METVQRLRGAHFSWEGDNLADLNRGLRQAARSTSFELHARVLAGASGEGGWKLLAGDGKYTTVGYSQGQLFVDRTNSGVTDFSPDFPARTAAPLAPGSGPLELTILVDRSTVEVFADGGRLAMSNLVYPPAEARGIEFNAPGRGTRISVELWELKSAWD